MAYISKNHMKKILTWPGFCHIPFACVVYTIAESLKKPSPFEWHQSKYLMC